MATALTCGRKIVGPNIVAKFNAVILLVSDFSCTSLRNLLMIATIAGDRSRQLRVYYSHKVFHEIHIDFGQVK